MSLAWWCGAAGLNDESAEAYRKSTGIDPENSTAWNNMADMLMKAGRVDEGIAAAKKATELDPKHAVAWCTLGECYQKAGRLDERPAARRTRRRPSKRPGSSSRSCSRNRYQPASGHAERPELDLPLKRHHVPSNRS
jgi:protein O-GlcNAc transferase